MAAFALFVFGEAIACDLKSPIAPTDSACARAWMDENLRVNDLMAVGTHNSYKLAIPDDEMAALKARRPNAGIATTQEAARAGMPEIGRSQNL